MLPHRQHNNHSTITISLDRKTQSCSKFTAVRWCKIYVQFSWI